MDTFIIQEPHKTRYYQFLESRPKRNLKRESGYNIHHVVPKCFGGTNDKNNLIKLTLREHYITHLILWKGCSGNKMAYAFKLLSNTSDIGCRLSSRQFEQLKIEIKHSKETKDKIAKAGIGRVFSEESKRKISIAKIGVKRSEFSDETRSRMSKGHLGLGKGKPLSEETKEKIRRSHIGLKPSDETRAKMSESRLGKSQTDATKTKIAESLRGKAFSEEHKAKISLAKKGKSNLASSKPVLCITTGEVFRSAKQATIVTGASKVSYCCNGNRKSAGRKNGVPLVWRYLTAEELVEMEAQKF